MRGAVSSRIDPPGVVSPPVRRGGLFLSVIKLLSKCPFCPLTPYDERRIVSFVRQTKGGIVNTTTAYKQGKCKACYRAERYGKSEFHAECMRGQGFHMSSTDCATGETTWTDQMKWVCDCTCQE